MFKPKTTISAVYASPNGSMRGMVVSETVAGSGFDTPTGHLPLTSGL